MRQLTGAQRRAQADAARRGRARVTMIDGRVAIILPSRSDPDDTAENIARIVRALEHVDLV